MKLLILPSYSTSEILEALISELFFTPLSRITVTMYNAFRVSLGSYQLDKVKDSEKIHRL